MMVQPRPQPIVLGEDNLIHARLIASHVHQVGIPNEVVVFSDSQPLLDYLQESRPLPSLIVLSRELPGFDSSNLLSRLKADDTMKRIPVVMMSRHEDQDDIDRCYALGCNVYVVKPSDYRQARETIRHLGQFLSIVRLPE